MKLVVRDQQGHLLLTCPTCRQVTPIPDRGVRGLQSAFHINHLLDIQKSVEKISASQEGGMGGITHHGSSPRIVSYCSKHNQEESNLYCETCETSICWKCVIEGGEHHSHSYELINIAFEQYKIQIASSRGPMKKQLAAIMNALVQVNACGAEISKQRTTVEADIHNTIRRLHEVLDVRKTELIHKLHQVTKAKLRRLGTQRDQLETTQARLISCLDVMKENLRKEGHEIKGELLLMKSTIVKQIEELTATFEPDTLKPSTEADIVFLPSVDFLNECQNYGQVSSLCLPAPSKSHVTGRGLKTATVGGKSTVFLQIISAQGTQHLEPLDSLDCELVSVLTGARTEGMTTERSGRSSYSISYQPTLKGKHQLHVKILGEHVKGSPFTIDVKSVEKISAPIVTIGEVGTPWGVALNRRGEVVVTSRNCVTILTPSGEKILSFGTHGSGHGQFQSPYGVAVSNEGDILVSDIDNHRIQKFTDKGRFLAAVGTKGNGHLEFHFPAGIAINPSNDNVYIADCWNNRIQVLNSDLTFSSTFGKSGSGKGQFNNPRGVACDSTGRVYVADRDNHRIQIFTMEGEFLRVFGKHGGGKGKLNSPVAIAIDANGILYISDSHNHRICMFTSEGHFVRTFGRFGDGPSEFKYPYGLAVDSSGVLYVCDDDNKRVQLF